MIEKSATSVQNIVAELQSLANPENVAGMARYGINPRNTLGVKVAVLRGIARRIGVHHGLAVELWDTDIHEARILAGLVADFRAMDDALLEKWALEIDSWDVCDGLCNNLIRKTPLAYDKAETWSRRHEEFVKRAGFTLMACLAVHDRKRPDRNFLDFLNIVAAEADDERNFVKKAVNWALRGIGKRNKELCAAALRLADELIGRENKTARWIGRDAKRELLGDKARSRLGFQAFD